MYTLTWQPPYDWQWMFSFLGARAVTGIETVTGNYYERSFACDGHRGVFRVTPDTAAHTLVVTLSPGLIPVAQTCLERIARLFDLACNPQLIADTLGDLGAARPGYLCFPTPDALAAADPMALKALGMPVKRAESLIHLAQSAIDGTFPLSPPADIEAGMKALQQRPGIGRWTANYLALRGWQAKDVFLPDDYLIKQRFAGMTPAQIRRYAERWQPWRSYALLHIWYTDGWSPLIDGEVTGIQQ